MDRKSFVLYIESREIINKLSIEQRGLLLTALFDHAQGEPVRDLDPLTDIVFTTIRNYMDKDFKKYESVCERNRRNINKRWEAGQKATTRPDTAVCDGIRANTTVQSGMNSNYDYNSDSYSDSYSDEEIKGDAGRVTKKQLHRFKPPTVGEVRQYVKQQGYKVDPETFVDYYEARGWELSKGRKIRDWKACVRTWEKNSGRWSKEKLNDKVTISEEQRSGYVEFGELFR